MPYGQCSTVITASSRRKGIDWDSVYKEYRARITPETNSLQLYSICADMLNELRDGHVNLSAPFATSYYKKWWSDYPQNYDKRLVDQYYLHFGGLTKNGLTYAMLPDSTGYMRYPSFSYGMSDGTLDWALAMLHQCHGLIIDIRDNGGGDISTVETFVARFINERILAGYISHKSGPGHKGLFRAISILLRACPGTAHTLGQARGGTHKPLYIQRRQQFCIYHAIPAQRDNRRR